MRDGLLKGHTSGEETSPLDDATIIDTIGCAKRLKMRLDGVFVELKVPLFRSCYTASQTAIATLRDDLLERQRMATIEAVAILKPIASASENGAVWYDNFKSENIKEVLDFATASLMTIDGPGLKQKLGVVVNALNRALKLTEIFCLDKPPDALQEAIDSCYEVISRARCTVQEATLVDVFRRHNTNPVKLKTVATNVMKSLKDGDKLHPTLWASAKAAKIWQFKLASAAKVTTELA